MKRFEIGRTLFGSAIIACVLRLEEGIQVSVSGGDLAHIGAVSVAAPDGDIATRQFTGHKDGVVSERWAKALSEAGYRPAVVTAGIHYDGLSKEGIAGVLTLTDEMLAELLHRMQ